MRTGRVAGVGDVKSCVIAAPARFFDPFGRRVQIRPPVVMTKYKSHGWLAVGAVLKNQPLNH
jgi:hypothetical protein